MEPLKIPLASERATIYDISVWEWSGSAYDEGAEAAEWFSTFFGNPTRLVRFKEGANLCFLQAFPLALNILLDEISYAIYGYFSFFLYLVTESETRLTDPDYARGYKTMFSDGFPFLITSQVLFFVPFSGFRINIICKCCWTPDNAFLFSGLTECIKWETWRAHTN